VPLADVAVGASVEVLRFENEAEDLLHYLKKAGMAPGLKGTLAESNGDDVVLQSNGDSVSVTRSVAETVSVRADPSPPPRTALPEQLVLGKDRYGR
jgi:DtxR family Mn-dependent transcriptional regulator